MLGEPARYRRLFCSGRATGREFIIQPGAARVAKAGFSTPESRRAPIATVGISCWGHKMPDDATEFKRAMQALLDRYPKDRILAALQETPLRPGPKRKDDTEMLIRMGRIMTWHRDLSDRAAAEIVTRHLPNNRSSVIDRIRKNFAKDRAHYLRSGKVAEIINLIMAGTPRSADETTERGADKQPLVTVALPDDDTLEAMFQELRSKLGAVCTLTDKDPVVGSSKLGEIRPE